MEIHFQHFGKEYEDILTVMILKIVATEIKQVTDLVTLKDLLKQTVNTFHKIL